MNTTINEQHLSKTADVFVRLLSWRRSVTIRRARRASVCSAGESTGHGLERSRRFRF